MTLRSNLQITTESKYTILLDRTWIICLSPPSPQWIIPVYMNFFFFFCFFIFYFSEHYQRLTVPLQYRKCLNPACSDMLGAIWSMLGWLYWNLICMKIEELPGKELMRVLTCEFREI